MPTHRERILAAVRGEMPDVLPYVPRIDLWYNANSAAGTIPAKYKGKTQDEISRSEGWALHKIVPEFLNIRKSEDTLHRALGIYALREMVYSYRFSSDIEIEAKRDGHSVHVTYHTPVGSVSTATAYTEEMRRAGASITWIEDHVLKGREDYKVVQYLFENLELIPDFDDFVRWKNAIGEDGVAVTMVSLATSPMHHIQKEFLDATEFYFHYHDYQKEMRALAEAVGNFYEQALNIVSDSPAEAVIWGGNVDDMITYPDYFEKEILPWIRRASEVLGEKGKTTIVHCDGENLGLMDLIRDSGMHVAEAVTPYPMTKVKIGEYYERWGEKITIWGGIPEILLMEETATEEDLDAYLDDLFKVIAPGSRFIAGIADTTPPKAVFDRLIRIGERVEREGRLPLKAGAFRPVSGVQMAAVAKAAAPQLVEDEVFKAIQQDVLKGDDAAIKEHVSEKLEQGFNAKDILNRGMLAAMEVIGERFKSGEVFIPEVLLSARAMNEALAILEPHLASEKKEATGKIVIGTVRGDMHDIGKNMVITMLRGVGFDVMDLGTNVPTDEFVKQVAGTRPDVLGISALLTTTMPEMKRIIDELTKAGLRSDVKVMVGGAPVNDKFAKDIGADGYAPDAGSAVTLSKELIQKR